MTDTPHPTVQPCRPRVDSASRGSRRAAPPRLVANLHGEWAVLVTSVAALDEVTRWRLPGSAPTSLDDVLARSGYRADVSEPLADDHDAGAADAYLLRLVEIGRNSPLAARIVLQRIIPPLCSVARRHRGADPNGLLLDDLIANAWTVIRCFPTERRRRHLAASLIRDISFETLIRPTRRRSAHEEPTAHDTLDRPIEDEPVAEPLQELAALVREARRVGLSDEDLALIRRLIRLGRTEAVAAELGVTGRTVRNHRAAMVRRLRNVASAA